MLSRQSVRRAVTSLVTCAAIVAAVGAGVSNAAAAEFRKIADLALSDATVMPQLSDGQVVWRDSGGTRIQLWDGSAVSTLLQAADPMPGVTDGRFTSFYTLAFDDGLIATTAVGTSPFGQRQGVFTMGTSSGAALQNVAHNWMRSPFTDRKLNFFHTVDVCNGHVAFIAQDADGVKGIYTSTDGTLTGVVSTNTTRPDGALTYTDFAGVRVHDDGGLTFAEDPANVSGSQVSALYSNESGAIVKLVDGQTMVPGGVGGFSEIRSAFDIFGQTVFFAGCDESGASGLYSVPTSGGSPRIEADGDTLAPYPNTGNFSSFTGVDAEQDLLAFGGGGELGIYARVGGEFQTLMRFEDTLDGKIIRNFNFTPGGADGLQVVVAVGLGEPGELSISSRAIYLITVPEPTSLGILALVVVPVLLRRRPANAPATR